MIYYVNLNKKRLVGRNNNVTSRPLTLEYDVTEVIDFQFIDDNNQIQPLSPQTAGLTLAIGLKQNMPSYDLLALSHDYEIVNGQILRFTVNTYTVNWLKKINKPNTEVFIEISQQSLESKKVWMRDYCYVWPRVWTAGLSPEEIASNDYYTKAETDEAIENAISGIVISGYVTEEQLEEGLATKQNVIDDENKLDYDLISGAPTALTGISLNGIPSEVTDNIVNIPRTSQNDWGVVKVNPGVGIGADSGQIYTIKAENAEIAARSNNFKPIVPSNLNTAVKAALTDSSHIELTDAEKETAMTVLGVDAAVSGYATETFVKNAVSGKQDAITNDNKLDYALVSGAPTVPTSTSQLTNDSGFVTSSVMEDALDTKQDLITEMDYLPGDYVHVDINHWSGDPDFTVQAAINMTRDDTYTALSGVDAVSGALSGKQDAITNDNKLDYSLLSGTPSIPLSTSELVNDSDFQTSTDVANAISGKLDAPSGGTEGQILTKTANGEEWADAQGGTIKVDDKVASGAFVVDFAGAQIQKYDVDSAVSGSLTIQYDNLDIPEGTAPTVELQVPVTGDVSTVNLPADTQVIEMPDTLTGGVYTYHDIVFRAQKDFNDAVKVYANYAYKFNEEINYLRFTANENNSAVALVAEGNSSLVPINLIEYSTDKENWQTYTLGNIITLQNVGDTVYIRGENPTFNFARNETNYNHFSMSGSIAGGGNVMTLFDKKGLTKTLGYKMALSLLFANCESLTTIPILPATTLWDGAYYKMFYHCTNIVNAQVLPAQNLAERCYDSMFAGCTSLKSAEIKATNIKNYSRCIQSMFTNATSLDDITVHFTEWSSDTTDSDSWVANVASNGTFKCPAALDTTIRDASHVPSNWTIVNI